MNKYSTNCPVLEEHGIHWSEPAGGKGVSRKLMLKNDPCCNCPFGKCRLGQKGFMIKSRLPKKEVNNVAT